MGKSKGEGISVNSYTNTRHSSPGILFISALDIWSMGANKGGPALYKTLTGYANQGWNVCFITSNRTEKPCEHVDSNIHIIRFDAPWLKRLVQIKKIGFFAKILWWLYFQVMALIKARKLRSKTKLDIVYGYEIHGVPVAKLLSKLWGVPMVSRFQGTSFGVGWQDRKFRFFRAWEHVVAHKISADLVIMTDDGTQGDKVLKQLGVNINKVRFWMNGVDWHLFENLCQPRQAKELLRVGDRFVLLCISRLVYWKRVDRSICALPDVVKKYPETILLIVGDGPDRRKLEQLAEELGVREHVRFMGAVPHSEIPNYLAAADIFLSFYDWSNVGNPLLEAMMARKCIVTLNNGDTGRFITNGENGVLLEYEDLAKLPEVIKRLLADKDLRNHLAANARKFAEENFWSWDERIEAEIAEVDRLIEERTKGCHAKV